MLSSLYNVEVILPDQNITVHICRFDDEVGICVQCERWGEVKVGEESGESRQLMSHSKLEMKMSRESKRSK